MLFLVLLACSDETVINWAQYNAPDNAVTVVVGSIDLLPTVDVMLTSSTGTVEIGGASVDPGGGPLGTISTLTIEVLEDYAADIGRVSVQTDSGSRGKDAFDLRRDSASDGIWVGEIQSVGEEGEVREDQFLFQLWQED